jgi:ATPase subunit of ABC transporter with duplicated ATPase domains
LSPSFRAPTGRVSLKQEFRMLTLDSITKFHGAAPILVEVTLAVPLVARIGVVGPNGAGKSTLLRIAAGLEEPDEGTVSRSPGTLTVGYMPQEPDARVGETLLGYLARRTGVAETEARLDALTQRLDGDAALIAAHAEALERFLALGGDDLRARARTACADVGLRAERLGLPMIALSGGEAARAALAAILLSRFDVLLLDEPTNNLDFEGLDRLERFVAGTRAGIVVVSHDRAFLDRTVTRVLELDEWTHRAREYAGGWSDYQAARHEARERQYKHWEESVEDRRRIEEQAAQMRQWEERGYGQGRKKKKSKDVKKAYEKKLERIETVDKPYEPWELRLTIEPERRAGKVVARLSDAVIERGSFRLGPLDFELDWGERVALLGPNGSGKTTIMDALLGRLPLVEGRKYVGPGVRIGELDQERGRFAGVEPLLDAFCREASASTAEARSLLAKFGLGADDVLRPARSLSPGERTRAAVALLAQRGVNCLLLDEPTNHLDLPAIEELEAALQRFDGTVLLVTHDRRFLDQFAATRTVELPSPRVPGTPLAKEASGRRAGQCK